MLQQLQKETVPECTRIWVLVWQMLEGECRDIRRQQLSMQCAFVCIKQEPSYLSVYCGQPLQVFRRGWKADGGKDILVIHMRVVVENDEEADDGNNEDAE